MKRILLSFCITTALFSNNFFGSISFDFDVGGERYIGRGRFSVMMVIVLDLSAAIDILKFGSAGMLEYTVTRAVMMS